jgi:hypothetical protein
MAGDEPVILVTGASSGIGEAVARRFGQSGYRVVLAARREDRLKSIAQEIQAAGGSTLPVVTDLSSLDQIHRLVESSLAEYGQIDVLCNNAGFGRIKFLEELDPVADIESQLQVNLTGLIQVTRSVLPHMIARQKGHIVNMASMAGFVGSPTYTIYAASKYGVRGFSEALRREVGVLGIRVTCVYPGGVQTDFAQHAGIQRKTGFTTPSRLRLSPEQVAQAVLEVVRRPRRTVILPRTMAVLAWLNYLFPGIVDWIVEQRFTRPERGL